MELYNTFVDVRSLITLFGGPKPLAAKLKAAGIKTTVKAIYKWSERQSIPGESLAQIFQLAKDRPESLPADAPRVLDVYAFIKDLKNVPDELLPKKVIPPVIKLKKPKNQPVTV